MATNPIEEKPSPQSITAYIKANAPRARKAQQMRHEESVVTREADYKGHHIVVRTTYQVEIDGKPLMGHMGVTDAGSVHYHPVPNLSFASALDMVRKIIDVFPDDFGPGAKTAAHAGHGSLFPWDVRQNRQENRPTHREEEEIIMAAVTRYNVVTNSAGRAKYVNGVKLLKAELLGPTTVSLGIPGPSAKVSTYDLFIVWHHVAMSTLTPPSQSDRNAAHRGPVFLPWHRFMLRQFELNLQRALNDNTFGLPYWDWAADGQLSAAAQKTAPIWQASGFGGQGNPVATGPFAQPQFLVKIEANSSGSLVQTNHGLRRAFAVNGATTLPKRANTAGAMGQTIPDQAPWNSTSNGFRNYVEGWNPNLGLHNRVHVWIGGDMLPSTSPNDPIFFMNHCNVDRIWEAWMKKPGGPGRVYLPDDTAPASLKGHRLHDTLSSLLSGSTTPAAMLNPSALYVYDSLVV